MKKSYTYILHASLSIVLMANIILSNAQEKVKLDNVINTDQFTEYAPSISSDGKTMILQSNRDGKYNLYSSKMENGKWTTPVSLDNVNAFRDSLSLIGGPSLSYDGNILYFFASESNVEVDTEDIFYSERQGEVWTTPKPIGEPINTDSYEGFPSIAADGKSIYFTRKATPYFKEGEKCFIIFRSELDRQGKWQKPLALPYPINTGCERAPRIMSDGKTLLFSSFREGGKGNFDLYMAKLQDNLEWTEPVNMDFVNSTFLDQFGAVSASGELLYINIEEGSHDIYYFTIPDRFRQNKNIIVQGYVTDKYTDKPLDASLSLLDASTNEEIYLAHTNPADGWYSIVLTEGKKYRIMATAPGYSDEELNFDLITIQKYEEVSQNIKLFANAKLAIKVFDKEKLTLTGANLTVKDGSGKVIPKLGKRAEEGKATLELPIDNKYTIEANEENFIGSSYSIDLTSLVKYEAFEQDMEIEPITLEFEFTVRDSETKAGINADIILLDKFSEQIRIRASEGKDGNFKRELRDGYKYEVDVHVPGKAYFSYSANIEASSKTGNNKLLIELTEIKPNLTFTLDNINFEVNSAELLETSFRELGKVIKLMREYPGISVELSAHTDSDGSDTYNMKLSEARAKSVVDYLLQYGLEVRRLTPKGYGETAPIAPNDTPENKALNRRVELKVLRVDVN